MIEIVIGAMAYLIVTFPYAFVWHMKFFAKKYKEWNYFGKNPKVQLGALSMAIQGIVLSYAYYSINILHESIASGITYSLTMGIFFWSTHVIAQMAKHEESRNIGFFTLETIYLFFQFAIFGILLSLVYILF